MPWITKSIPILNEKGMCITYSVTDNNISQTIICNMVTLNDILSMAHSPAWYNIMLVNQNGKHASQGLANSSLFLMSKLERDAAT